MDIKKIETFIRKQKIAFIGSVDEEGFPNVKAMLKPRKNRWCAALLFFYKYLFYESKTV